MDKTLEQQKAKQKEIEAKAAEERRQKEHQKKLLIRAQQVKMMAQAKDIRFFEFGKEECELLEKFFPEDARKLKERLKQEERKEKNKKGSVDYDNLLMEIEGLCSKAFKVMLENLKRKEQRRVYEESKREQSNEVSPAERSSVENVQEAPEKSTMGVEKEEIVVEKNRDAYGLKEKTEDGYAEAMTGEKPQRQEQPKEYEVKVVSKKEQKKLDKEQKKAEKAQRKAEKSEKSQKVQPISMDAVKKEMESMGQGIKDAKTEQMAQQKLDAYNKQVQARAQANKANQRESGGPVREMSGPARRK